MGGAEGAPDEALRRGVGRPPRGAGGRVGEDGDAEAAVQAAHAVGAEDPAERVGAAAVRGPAAAVWTIRRWLTTSTGVHTTCAATAADTPPAAEAAADAAGSATPRRTAAEPTALLVASSAAM